MNILIVLYYSPDFGGSIVQHLSALGKAANVNGHKLILGFTKKRDWQIELETTAKVIVIPQIEKPLRSGFPGVLRKICKENAVDIVHFQFLFALPASLAFNFRRWNLPVIQHWHNPPVALNNYLTPSNKIKGKLKRMLSSLVARFTDRRIINRHISTSLEISNLLVKNRWTDQEKISFLLNGLSPIAFNSHNFKSNKRRIPVVGAISNFRPQKDHSTLVRAFNILCKSGIQSELWLVGDGPTRLPIEELVKELDISSRVRFIGTVTNLAEMYSQFDIFVLSSHYEGHSLVTLDAMSLGLPIVATRISSIPETITHGVNGLLVNPKDPQDLAEAIKKLLNDPSLAQRLGATAKKTIEQHLTIDEWSNFILEIYEDVIKNYHKRG